MEKYQAIVLGGGPGGYSAAIRLGKAGVRTLIVDHDGLGGVCIREGCIPSKSLLHHTAGMDKKIIAKTSPDDPILVGLRKKSQGPTQRLVRGIDFLLKKAGVTHVNGWGTILDGNRLLIKPVEGEKFEVRWEKLVLAAGSVAFDPIGLPENKNIWDSTRALSLPYVPESLVVAGGGYVGLELATIYARTGSKVTIIEMMDHVLPMLAPDVARLVTQSLKRQGIRVITNAKIKDVDTETGVEIIYESKDKETKIQTDCLLNAVGRRPRTDGFGLETLGIDMTDRGFVFVDDTMRTSRPDVFAIGDLAGPPMLAHKAYAESRVAALNIAGIPTEFRARAIPSIVFTDPPAGVVGMVPHDTEGYLKGQFPMTASGRGVAEGETAGFVRVWARTDSHEIVACEVVGKATETVIAEAGLAIQNNLTLENIEETVHMHPTYAETFAEACEIALGNPLHIP